MAGMKFADVATHALKWSVKFRNHPHFVLTKGFEKYYVKEAVIIKNIVFSQHVAVCESTDEIILHYMKKNKITSYHHQLLLSSKRFVMYLVNALESHSLEKISSLTSGEKTLVLFLKEISRDCTPGNVRNVKKGLMTLFLSCGLGWTEQMKKKAVLCQRNATKATSKRKKAIDEDLLMDILIRLIFQHLQIMKGAIFRDDEGKVISKDFSLRRVCLFFKMCLNIDRRSDAYVLMKSISFETMPNGLNVMKFTRGDIEDEDGTVYECKRKGKDEKKTDHVFIPEAKGLPINPYAELKKLYEIIKEKEEQEKEQEKEKEEKEKEKEEEKKNVALFKRLDSRRRFMNIDLGLREISEQIKKAFNSELKNASKEQQEKFKKDNLKFTAHCLRNTMIKLGRRGMKDHNGENRITNDRIIATQSDHNEFGRGLGAFFTYDETNDSDALEFPYKFLVHLNLYFMECYELVNGEEPVKVRQNRVVVGPTMQELVMEEVNEKEKALLEGKRGKKGKKRKMMENEKRSLFEPPRMRRKFQRTVPIHNYYAPPPYMMNPFIIPPWMTYYSPSNEQKKKEEENDDDDDEYPMGFVFRDLDKNM